MPDCYDVVYQGWLHARLLQYGLPLCWLHARLLVLHLQCGLPLCWLHARLLQCGLSLCWLHARLLVLQCGLPLCWLHTGLLQCGLPMLAAYQTAVVWLTNADCMPDCYTYTKLQCITNVDCIHLTRLLWCGWPLLTLTACQTVTMWFTIMLTAYLYQPVTVWFTSVDCMPDCYTYSVVYQCWLWFTNVYCIPDYQVLVCGLWKLFQVADWAPICISCHIWGNLYMYKFA